MAGVFDPAVFDPGVFETGSAPPEITTTSLPDGEVGTPYSETVSSTGGTAPLVWSIEAGALPDGLTLDADTGEISGTPTTSALVVNTFTVRVTDDTAQFDEAELTISFPPPDALPPGGRVPSVACGHILHVEFASEPETADPPGGVAEPPLPSIPARSYSEPPFDPVNWTNQGTPMPSRPFSEVPTEHQAVYNGELYIAYQGQYDNQSVGYTEGTNVRVGCIVRTDDGVNWTTVFNGAALFEGKRHWMPGQMFVAAGTLYCLMVSAGFHFVNPSAYFPAGEIALMKTTNGTTWEKVTTFKSWTQKNNGFGGSPNVETATKPIVWYSRRSGPDGEDAHWVSAGYSLRCDGVSGTFFEAGTLIYRSLDNGATWTLVRDMKGVYPFASNPTTLDAPDRVLSVKRSSSEPDRWFMFGGTGALNYSDDLGETWTQSTYSGLLPFVGFTLRAGGMVVFSNGTGAFSPDVKVSCDKGETFTTVAAYSAATPANVLVAAVQFNGLEELVVAVRDNTGLSTSIWYTSNGGETWTELGQLATVFANPVYLAWFNGIMVLYTGTTAVAGGPQVWTIEDSPAGVATARSVCPGLTPVRRVAAIPDCGPTLIPTMCVEPEVP